ncbi:hypothetical protein POM88_046777 [Heracleum sosnowskyi]|uniref:Uncharacterized protein n=1 Tax=Heracleum sosnowskyi TaxID=360622 RepID=A0AAD8H9B5_9APIA|nr:hypothetical protein POM88_046777 [Heracleum sosnowskyi]
MRNSNRSTQVWASEKEYEVAEILLNLPQLFSCSSPSFRIASLLSTSCWGSFNNKRRRSAIEDDDEEVAVVNKDIQATTPLNRAVTPSPSPHRGLNTPRRNNGCKIKTTKEDLQKKIEELTQCRDSLKRGVAKVGEYYDQLLTENSFLKAKRQHQLRKCYVKEGKTKITNGLKNGD